MLFLNLKNFVKNIPSKYILLAIVALGFALRINNLTIGFPALFISNDEAIYHQSALNMLSAKTPFTIGNYGPLGAYLQIPFLLLAYSVLLITGKVHSISGMEFLLVTQEGYLLFIPRIISAMFGTLSILVIYKLSRELFRGKRVAILASFFCAVSFNLVHISHLARGWSPAIFFSLLATYYAIKSIRMEKDYKNTILTFSFAAIAFGFHQISGIIIILICLIKLFSNKSFIGNIKSYANILGIFCWGSLIFLFNYLSAGKNIFRLISPNQTKVGLVNFPQSGHNLGDFLNFFISNKWFERVPRDLLLTDGLIAIFAFSFFLLKINRSKIYLAFLFFIIFNFVMIMTIFPPLLRYTLISISFLPLFAGFTFEKLLTVKKVPVYLIIILLFLISFNSFYWNYQISKKATFEQLREWVEFNIDPATPIAVTARRNIGWVPTKFSSDPIRYIKPKYYEKATRLIDGTYPPNVRSILYLEEFGQQSKVDNLMTGLKIFPTVFVIDSYYSSRDRIINQKTNHKFALVAHFSPSGKIIYDGHIQELLFDASYVFPLFKIDRAGPYFDVLKILR